MFLNIEKQIIAQHSVPVSVTKWSSKKIVTLVTYHSHDTRAVTIRGKEGVRPISVLDYNQSVIVVDLTNQLIHSYLYERSK
jgi:hypothetical protein